MNREKQRLNVIVVEDNRIFNSILTKALNQHILKHTPVSDEYEVKLFSFASPEECLDALYEDEFKGNSIAFLDYYLGGDTNGIQILNVFRKKNKNIKFVVLSQSNLLAKNTITKAELNGQGHFLKKDIYAPYICCLLMEDFVQSQT